jgi:hypothetical protein
MTAIEYWQRIAANAHKVPGLTVRLDQPARWLQVLVNGAEWTLDKEPRSGEQQRRYALLVVDAIEAAFKEWVLERHGRMWRPSYLGNEESALSISMDYAGKEDSECLSLLEAILYLLESLPAEGEK